MYATMWGFIYYSVQKMLSWDYLFTDTPGIFEKFESCKKKKSCKQCNNNKMLNFWDIGVDVFLDEVMFEECILQRA